MSNKLEKLRQATNNSFEGLYIGNEKPIQQPVEELKEDKPQPIQQPKEEKKEIVRLNKMVSFRIPIDVIDKIDKYSYIERMTKQDVIIKGLEYFFNSKEIQDVLSHYDDIKEGKYNE